jgi:ribose transport system ATP-binding protein
VLRDGHVVGSVPVPGTPPATLVKLIAGSDVQAIQPLGGGVVEANASPALTVTDLCGEVARNVSLTVSQGEIVGLTGLVGMGQEEIPPMVYGALPTAGGVIRVHDKRVSRQTPAKSIADGVVYIPANRATHGVALAHTVAANVSLPALRGFWRRGRLQHARIREDVERRLVEYNVRPPSPDHLIGQLSGGNQQKAVLAKWFHLSPSIILLEEPTQGIDVGARRVTERRY